MVRILLEIRETFRSYIKFTLVHRVRPLIPPNSSSSNSSSSSSNSTSSNSSNSNSSSNNHTRN